MPAGPDSAGSRLLVGRLAFTVWMVDTGVDTQAQPGVDTFSSHAVAVSLEGRDQAFCSFLGKHAGPCMKLRTQQGCGRGSGPAPTQVGACSVRTWLSHPRRALVLSGLGLAIWHSSCEEPGWGACPGSSRPSGPRRSGWSLALQPAGS